METLAAAMFAMALTVVSRFLGGAQNGIWAMLAVLAYFQILTLVKMGNIHEATVKTITRAAQITIGARR